MSLLDRLGEPQDFNLTGYQDRSFISFIKSPPARKEGRKEENGKEEKKVKKERDKIR